MNNTVNIAFDFDFDFDDITHKIASSFNVDFVGNEQVHGTIKFEQFFSNEKDFRTFTHEFYFVCTTRDFKTNTNPLLFRYLFECEKEMILNTIALAEQDCLNFLRSKWDTFF